MSYYLIKCLLKRSSDAKVKKESFVVKASNIVLAEAKVISELSPVDPEVKTTDINLKNYVEVFTTVDNTGPYYEINSEWEETDGKVVKECYLQQAGNTVESEASLVTNVGDYFEVVSNKKTTITDYFIGL